jgi:hypothetical protein
VADKQSFGLINLRGTTTDELRRELQLQLQHIATRLDELAGTRGTPTFYGNVNANGKRFTNAGTPVNAQDLQRVDCCLHREDNNPTRDFDADFRRILNLEAAEFLTQAVNLDQLRRELSVGLTGATAQNAPPEVEDASAIGSVLQRYAREDHTHSGANLSDAQTIGGAKTFSALSTFSSGLTFGDETLSTYDTGTFSITGTGFAADPSDTASYVLVGSLVLLFIPQLTGTSDATTFTLTGIPTAIRAASSGSAVIRFTDNGSASATPGLLVINTGATAWDLYTDLTGTGWTDANTKTLEAMFVAYHIL